MNFGNVRNRKVRIINSIVIISNICKIVNNCQVVNPVRESVVLNHSKRAH